MNLAFLTCKVLQSMLIFVYVYDMLGVVHGRRVLGAPGPRYQVQYDI